MLIKEITQHESVIPSWLGFVLLIVMVIAMAGYLFFVLGYQGKHEMKLAIIGAVALIANAGGFALIMQHNYDVQEKVFQQILQDKYGATSNMTLGEIGAQIFERGTALAVFTRNGEETKVTIAETDKELIFNVFSDPTKYPSLEELNK